MKNIVVLYPESEFNSDQLHKLGFAGKVSFTDSISSGSLSGQAKYLKNADIIAFSPDVFGTNAKRIVSEILEKSPNIKGLAFNSTRADFINMDYCQKKGIAVTVVPDYTAEAIAEYTILLLLACARRVLINRWQSQQNSYPKEIGCELAGKTIGIIGVNTSSERLIKLLSPFGCRIFFLGDSLVRIEGAQRKSLDEVLYASDFIILNLPDSEENNKFLSKERISRLQQGAVVINLSGRNLVDDKWMAEALENRLVDQYVFETETIKPSPFDKTSRAVPLKHLSDFTKESKERSKELWVINVANMASVSTS